jgi:hypothetical protein
MTAEERDTRDAAFWTIYVQDVVSSSRGHLLASLPPPHRRQLTPSSASSHLNRPRAITPGGLGYRISSHRPPSGRGSLAGPHSCTPPGRRSFAWDSYERVKGDAVDGVSLDSQAQHDPPQRPRDPVSGPFSRIHSYSPRSEISPSRRDQSVYTLTRQLEKWHHAQPIQHPETQPLPHILLMHMLYQLTTIYLHRPFYRSSAGRGPSPAERCDSAAEQVMVLLKLFDGIHGMRTGPMTLSRFWISGFLVLHAPALLVLVLRGVDHDSPHIVCSHHCLPPQGRYPAGRRGRFVHRAAERGQLRKPLYFS